MAIVRRSATVFALVVSLTAGARAQEGDPAQTRAKLEEAKRAIAFMRETQAHLLRKEEDARAEHDGVLLNTLHQISNRVVDLINVAHQSLEDMRVAMTSDEPVEAVTAELEKIMLAKTKVEQARNEADRSVGIKLLTSNEGDDSQWRTFTDEAAALTGDNPVTLDNTIYVPIVGPPPAASPTN